MEGAGEYHHDDVGNGGVGVGVGGDEGVVVMMVLVVWVVAFTRKKWDFLEVE